MRPVLFHIGSYPVYSYGAFLFLAFLAGVMVAGRELGRRGEDASAIYPVGAVAAFSGVLGARLFYVLGHWGEFSGDWSSIFDLNMRGLVFYGGLALALPACVLIVRRMGLAAGKVADAVGLTLPLSLAVARVGCFLNGCCGGKPSGLPWAVTFPGTSTAVHPTQLYELLLDLAFFFLLLRWRKRVVRDWDLFLLAVGGYGAIRLFNEFFRYHSRSSAGVFFQAVSATVMVLSLATVWYRERRTGGSQAVGGFPPDARRAEAGMAGGTGVPQDEDPG
ncbi:prolipoprotein diacylglyceryl transferase family protein [Candidatus Solincola tengchongensis]|uniref:prolipoprotein diacylglyceryl transferase n=1 Tax=Candidatus Solincola tengchongensis TaxID=2900693 RepID=UPI0025799FD4